MDVPVDAANQQTAPRQHQHQHPATNVPGASLASDNNTNNNQSILPLPLAQPNQIGRLGLGSPSDQTDSVVNRPSKLYVRPPNFNCCRHY